MKDNIELSRENWLEEMKCFLRNFEAVTQGAFIYDTLSRDGIELKNSSADDIIQAVIMISNLENSIPDTIGYNFFTKNICVLIPFNERNIETDTIYKLNKGTLIKEE